MATGYTVEDFVDAFPEFDSEGAAPLIELKLDEAKGTVSTTAFGDDYEKALGLKTAELLWESAFGVTLRQEGESSSASKYRVQYMRLVREKILGFAVT